MLRQEQKERTHQVILDSAAVEFNLHGYACTRTMEIIDRIGLSKGALYHHFQNKIDIADELNTLGRTQWAETLAVDESAGRGLTALHALWRSVFGAVHEHPRLQAYLRLCSEGVGEGGTPLAELQALFVSRLQQAIADKEVRETIDTRGTSAALIDIAWGVLMSQSPWGGDDTEARLDHIWDLIQPGLQAR